MTTPKVSCMMPVRDTHDPWLWTAIRCVATQTHPNLDLLICDNGSTKATTIATLKEAEETWPERVRLTRENRPGTAYALDACLKIADPETAYFTKADSDDTFYKDREKNRVALFETLPPQVSLVYDNYLQLIYEPRPHTQAVILRPYDYRVLLESNYIHGNAMWRASVYETIPRTFVYDGYEGKTNRHGEDYAHWLAITDHWDGFWFNADPALTWTYRVYSDSKYMKDRKGVDYCRALLQHRAKERRGLL